MKKNTLLPILKLSFLMFCLLVTTITTAQISWDGGGDGTSWNDAANWSNDMVPAADSIVEFTEDAMVAGTADNGVVRITVRGGAEVTLDLDLTIGNGTTDEHAIVISALSSLTLGAGSDKTFVLNPPSNKQGIAIFGSSDTASVTVAENATIQVLQGTNGINIANTSSSFTNGGTIVIENEVKNGIKTSGTFVNNSIINIGELQTDGIIVGGGMVENSEGGVITITKPGDDCLELIGSSLFTNSGQLDLVAQDSASSGNNAIAIGSATELAEFVNTATGMLNADGGDKENGRTLYVYEMGTLTNDGGQIELVGGGAVTRFYNRGTSVNGKNGIVDMTDGRMNLNMGSFTNNGLIKTTYDGGGILTSGLATNNGFFDYANSNSFAGGMNGTVVNNGINLNSENSRTINGGGSCDLDIAEASYEYFEGATSIGTTDDTGALTLGMDALTADSVVVTTSIAGVELIVKNVCAEAVMTSSVFGVDDKVNRLKLFPSLVDQNQPLTIDISGFYNNNITVEFYNMNGALEKVISSYGEMELIVATEYFNAGLHLVRVSSGDVIRVGKFMKVN